MSLVELARYSDAALAHIVKGRLEAEGIPAFCFDTGANVMEGIPMLFKVRIMVHADDLDAAQRLIAEEQAGAADEAWDDVDDEAMAPIAGRSAGRRRGIAGCFLLMFFLPTLVYLIVVAARLI